MSRPPRTISLRGQLLRRLVLPLLALLLVGGYADYRIALHYANLTFDAWLDDSARALAQQVKVSGGRTRIDLPRAAIEMFEWDSHDQTYYSVTAGSEGVVFGNVHVPHPDRLPQDQSQPVHYDTRVAGQAVRVAAVTLAVTAPAAGEPVLIQVAETLNKRNALAREMLLALLVPQGLLLIGAVIVVAFGVSGGLRPLAELARQIRWRHSGDLSPLRTDVPVEVAPLTVALNRLFAELDEAQQAQRRFIADAAHQLRTPLATLQVQAERALRERDPQAGAQAVRSVLTAAQGLGHLVHQLLTMARAEPAGAAPTGEPCDLAALAREAAADWVPAALERDVDLGYSGPEKGVVVAGNPLLLRELVNNLIDNALKYGRRAAGDSHVTVSVGGGPLPRVAVEDNGPGIPDEAREQVFERFVRLPGNSDAGCGLGLPIVREIAARHGGTVAVGPGADGIGARVVVTFMAATATPVAAPEQPAGAVAPLRAAAPSES